MTHAAVRVAARSELAAVTYTYSNVWVQAIGTEEDRRHGDTQHGRVCGSLAVYA